jgi:hypothetical protein
MTRDDIETLMSAVGEVVAEYVAAKLAPINQRLDALEAATEGKATKPRQRVPAGRQDAQP